MKIAPWVLKTAAELEPFVAKTFPHLSNGIPGLSSAMLKDHLKLYEGYVKNTNSTLESFLKVIQPSFSPAEHELRRRLGWEFAGMRLHEYYFENLSAKETTPGKEFVTAVTDLRAWEEDFRRMTETRGIGWVALVYDKSSKMLLNIWINEHNEGHIPGAEYLLVIDLFEHAYTKDYGINREEYKDAFMKAIDWDVVEERFKRCRG